MVRTQWITGPSPDANHDKKDMMGHRKGESVPTKAHFSLAQKKVFSGACSSVSHEVCTKDFVCNASSLDGHKSMLIFGIGAVPNGGNDASTIAYIPLGAFKSFHNALATFAIEKNFSLTDCHFWRDESAALKSLLIPTLQSIFFVKKGDLCFNGGIMSVIFLSAIFLHHLLKESGSLLVHTFTQIPVGAGLGSSASFGTALVASVFSMISADDDVFSWTNVSETIIHGTSSGLDPLTCTLGGSIYFVKDQATNQFHLSSDHHHLPRGLFAVVRQFSLRYSCPTLSMAILYSGMPRNTRDMVTKVKKFRESNLGSFTAVIDSIGNIAGQALDLFLGKTKPFEFSSLFELISKNQEFLCSPNPYGLDVDSEEFIHLRTQLEAIGNQSGAFTFASKITGAGGGGCALYIFPSKNERDSFLNIIADSNVLSLSPFPRFFPVEIDACGVQMKS